MQTQDPPKDNAATPPTMRGAAGERHQQAGESHPELTTNQGMPIADNQNSLRAYQRGPTLLEDFIFREKMTHFDHERIPERVVHARGSAAHGYFELTDSLADVTIARLFTEVGERTPVFCRFSTVAGSKGSIDTPRDVRGFAVKFYTKDGNYDLVGNNIPVFFIQDAMKFPDLVHSVKPEPDRGFPQATAAHDTFWDFVTLSPESMHMVMWAMSDRTLPRSLRMMEGFGVHSFRFLDAEGRSTFVKFHWRPRLGMQSTLWDEASKISGADIDYHTQLICLGGPNFQQIPINQPRCPFADHYSQARQFYISQTEHEQAHMALYNEESAVAFAKHAYIHLKAIAVDAGGRSLLEQARVEPDEAIVDVAEVDSFLRHAVTRLWKRESLVRKLH